MNIVVANKQDLIESVTLKSDAASLDATVYPELSRNAKTLLADRFLLSLPEGFAETPHDMMRRVARTLAQNEPEKSRQEWEETFFNVMAQLLFHPGSRVMANAGTANHQLANCFVLPLEDDRHSILKTFAIACDIKGNGGGCGFNYSAIRPRGDHVREHPDLACGPAAFLKLFDEASAIFRQRGRYESGNMAIINVDHPDVLEFISSKKTDGSLRLTNISVGISERFMEAVKSDTEWRFKHPTTGNTVAITQAKDLFRAIATLAWETGDPGLIFLDRINEDNPLLEVMGPINATNTCGEIGLYPYESCNLGYLNLTRLLLPADEMRQGEIFDFAKVRNVVHTAIRMIDNAISATWFPIEEINQSVSNNRRAGLGVTGWADCLSTARIPYDSDRAIAEADIFAKRLRAFAEEISMQLALEKGPYPNSKLTGETQKRNIALLALPPSGNNAIIFDTSFSIEPHFSLSYSERVMGDQVFQHRNKLLVAEIARLGLDADTIFDRIEASGGSVQDIAEIPEQIRACFKTAHEIAPDIHVKMQAAFQNHVDNAVTKTVNLPRSTTIEEVERIYFTAWKERCKGITIYRDGSRGAQVIEFSGNLESETCEAMCEECIVRLDQ